MAWCPQDPDLLLSCAKDNRILCWNPNSSVQNGEVGYCLKQNLCKKKSHAGLKQTFSSLCEGITYKHLLWSKRQMC